MRYSNHRKAWGLIKTVAQSQIFILSVAAFFLFGITLFPHSAQGRADDNYAWTQQNQGLFGGNIVGLVIDPDTADTLYALTKGSGVYKTTDGGSNWSAVNTGLPSNKDVSWGHLYGELLTLDPNDDQTMYAAFEGKVYKTSDGGSNWSESNTGIEICAPNYQIAGVAIDPSDSTHLFAGHVASGCGGGIYESNDSGTNWTRVPDIGIGNDVWMLAFNPTDVSKVYSATQYIGFSYSHDGGTTWVNNNPSGSTKRGIFVGTHPTTTSRVFYGSPTGLYISEDDGVTWTSYVDDVPGALYDIDFFDDNQAIGFAVGSGGLFKTVNSGVTWSEVGSHDAKSLKSIEIDSTASTTLYIGSSATGMYKSTDGGTTLSTINSGLPISLTILTLEIAPSDTTTYYLDANGLGFYRSTDRGYTWTLQDSSISAFDIAIDPTDKDTVFAGYTDINKTTDGGATWSTVLSSTTLQTFPVISVDPSNANHILTYDATNKYLYRTLDGGDTWSTVDGFSTSATAIYNIVFDPTDSDKVYTGTYNAFWKSTDNGASWTQVTTGLPGGSSGWIDGTAIDPTDVTTLYVGLRSLQVYKSIDSGDTWSNTNYSAPGETTTNRVIVDSSGTVHAFTSLGWQKSTDGGDSWSDQPFVDANTGFFRGPGQIDPADTTRFTGSGTTEGLFIYENYIPLFDTSTITVSDDNGSSIEVGDTLSYTVTVNNTGPATGNNITISFPIPSPFFSFVANSGTINNASVDDFDSGETISLNVGNLQKDESVEVDFQIQVDAETASTYTLTITSDEDTSGTSADSVSVSIESQGSVSGSSGGSGNSSNNEDDEISEKDTVSVLELFARIRSYLKDLQAQGLPLPSWASAFLASIPVNTAGLPQTDLTVGSIGNGVTWLQNFLVTKNLGTAATALSNVGSTGYFGPLTQAALAEYQASVGIRPAVGYYGPITRSYITNNE